MSFCLKCHGVMCADGLHNGFFSAMAGEDNDLTIIFLRIFIDQSQGFFHAVVVHARETFVKEKRREVFLIEQLDQSYSQTDIGKIACARAQKQRSAYCVLIGE